MSIPKNSAKSLIHQKPLSTRSLKSQMKYQFERGLQFDTPFITHHTCEVILANCEEEGIFRKSGNNEDIERVMREYDQGL